MGWTSGLVRASAFLALFFAVSANANAQQGMIWQSGSFTDESNGGQLHAYLTFSVPETDNTGVYAFCNSGSNFGKARLAVSVNTGNLPSGSPASLRFFGNGFDRTYQGDVSDPQGRDGAGAIAVDISNDDPLWQALAGLPVISLETPTGVQAALPLRGSSGPVREFTRLCRSFVQLGGPLVRQQGGNQAFDARWQTCETLGGQRAQNSDTPISVTFVNVTDGYRSVMWVGFDGVPKNYANLNPGESFSVSTFLTHPWMVTDGPGNCLEMFMPELGVETFNISAPNRDFGPE